MPRSILSQLDRLDDWFVEDILSMSDEEILTEAREDGQDPVERAGAMIRIFAAVCAQCRGEH